MENNLIEEKYMETIKMNQMILLSRKWLYNWISM